MSSRGHIRKPNKRNKIRPRSLFHTPSATLAQKRHPPECEAASGGTSTSPIEKKGGKQTNSKMHRLSDGIQNHTSSKKLYPPVNHSTPSTCPLGLTRFIDHCSVHQTFKKRTLIAKVHRTSKPSGCEQCRRAPKLWVASLVQVGFMQSESHSVMQSSLGQRHWNRLGMR